MQAKARSCHLVDLENKLAVSANLGGYSDHERNLAKLNIDNQLTLAPSHIPNLVLFDRGFPSADFIYFLLSKGVHFLMRASSSFFIEVARTQSDDEIDQIVITSQRAKDLKKHGTPLPKGTVLTVRVVKVPLSHGETEILLTDVSADVLGPEECKCLYAKRWGIETRFNELKHQFEMENFSGETPTVIEQDYYATVLLSNMASIIEQDAEEEMGEEKKNAEKPLKHETYKINHNN